LPPCVSGGTSCTGFSDDTLPDDTLPDDVGSEDADPDGGTTRVRLNCRTLPFGICTGIPTLFAFAGFGRGESGGVLLPLPNGALPGGSIRILVHVVILTQP
jgi:hypothetical protein